MEKQTFFQSCLKNLKSVVQTLHLLELDLCERACLSATFISHQSLVEKRASVFEKRASVLSLEATFDGISGPVWARPFIYWDNHSCRHALLLLLDLLFGWVLLYMITLFYTLTFLHPSSSARCTIGHKWHPGDWRTGSVQSNRGPTMTLRPF